VTARRMLWLIVASVVAILVVRVFVDGKRRLDLAERTHFGEILLWRDGGVVDCGRNSN
jgi:hypothetical protein